VTARWLPTISHTNCDAPTAANWQSTPSGCHAANKPSAKHVRSFHRLWHRWKPRCRASSNRFIGHSNLPQSCPVCEHSPLSAADCSPNKSLRTTIRVFLRTAEKKREASRTKESNDTTPITPVDAPKPSLPDVGALAAETAEKTADASGDVPVVDAVPQSADEPASGHEEDKLV
jgi:hypothetical protein